jgi:hypothetical protein
VLHALGAEVRYFRPPYGNYTPETAAQAETLGMTIMLWSLDSRDWKRQVSRFEGLRNVSPTVQQSFPGMQGLRSVSPVMQQSFPGMRGVLLFHDTHKNTVDKMPDILDTLIAGGCERFVTVSEYMTKAPQEEERPFSAQASNEGQMPPPSLARGLSGARVGGVPAWANMRTQPAHPVQARNPVSMGTQSAHSAPDGAHPSETLMTGIVADGRSSAAHGRIPRLLSEPGLFLPAHKPNRGKQDPKRGENNPG